MQLNGFVIFTTKIKIKHMRVAQQQEIWMWFSQRKYKLSTCGWLSGKKFESFLVMKLICFGFVLLGSRICLSCLGAISILCKTPRLSPKL